MIKAIPYSKGMGQEFQILICLIQIWDKKDGFMTPPKNCLEIAEVESIEIVDNYKQLINKASVKFPRGTVIRKTSETVELVKEDAKKVDAALDERGVLLTTRKTYNKVATVADFSYGKRIRIYLGYTADPEIASLPKFNGKRGTIFTDPKLHKKYMEAFNGYPPMFDGYISRCSIDTPIEIECENLASVLKQFNAPDIPNPTGMTVNDLLAEDGKYNILKDTGFKLFPETKKSKIDIGKVLFNRDLTVADVLSTWTKWKLYSYVWVDYSQTPAQPYVVVGRSYFTNCGDDSIIKQRESHGLGAEYNIYFDHTVAENNLTLTESNKDYLCVQGQSMDKDGKFYHMTIRKNPDWHVGDSESDKWQILNEVKLTKRMQRMGATMMSKGNNPHVDLNRYTIVPYMSAKIGVTHEELLQELIAYYESFHMNGISGTLTLFGELQLKSGCKVHLYDSYYPAKNGVYFVDEVTTKFGVQGFRQTIKLPYLIKSDKDDENTK